jgi:serine/threonine-protein kinase
VDRTGQVLDRRYRLDALIGRGAMAEVYRAVDLQTSEPVALKILRRNLSGDPEVRQRFAREAEVQAKVRHPNVAAVRATGVTADAEPYLIVELLRGKTLRHVIKTAAPLPPRRAASYAWQALQGLIAVHATGVLHRDLKPANVMLEPSPGPVERVVLIDFGFATLAGSAKLTQQGTVVGSLTYIAPERLRGEDIDQRSDLYAIGVILFEMLDGAPPFSATNEIRLAELALGSEPPPLATALPGALRAIVGRALAKHPEDRFADAADMAAAIERAAPEIDP